MPIDASLPDDTPIYRMFNLHDLITTIENKELRMAQALTMEDKNELIGEYLLTFNSIFGPMTRGQHQERISAHPQSQAVRHMTCWTMAPDNIAVWALYSREYEGILVRSTIGKLKAAIETFYIKRNFAIAYSLEPNDPRDLFYPPEIGRVVYVDFSEMFDRVVEIRENYENKIRVSAEEAGSWDDLDVLSALTWRDESSQELFRERGSSSLLSGLLKDKRYEHEREFRAIIRLVRRDERTKTEYESHPLAGLDDPIRIPPPVECLPNIFIPIGPHFIDTLQMDGRLPAWRRVAVEILFKKFGYDITPSSAFNSILEHEKWEQGIGRLRF
ncbi:hypothetical protein LJR231_002768 [Phyllobacterium sp. LjRoot231]|uniref:hypothetical protein n=1 Tax=Phyllobacterium sp. LjRoot231 TaxID=3342289 RepID=UPI003ECC73D7